MDKGAIPLNTAPDQTIVVKYKTQKSYCACCSQKLPNPEMSKVREIEISKEGALSWVDWQAVAEYPEDMESLVPEFVHETISFFAINSYEKIIIEDSEIERVKEFITSLLLKEEPI